MASFLRTGLIAVKKGVTATFDTFGARVCTTVLQVQDCQVMQVLNKPDGRVALQLGAVNRKPKNLYASQVAQFEKLGLNPKQYVKEFYVSEDCVIPAGTELLARHFNPGQLVDVTGWTVGKGFAGAMKRWNFKGGPASHGSSKFHRGLGSTGNRKQPGRVFKGKKMPGRLGNEKDTQLNLEVFRVDALHNLIFLRGAVPGHTNSVVFIRDAVKAKHGDLPVPTWTPEEGQDLMEFDLAPPSRNIFKPITQR